MAAKRKTSSKTAEVPAPGSNFTNTKSKNWLVTSGWVLLLIGGLGHMLPGQMDTVLKFSFLGLTVQMLVGILSVLISLNFLLGDE